MVLNGIMKLSAIVSTLVAICMILDLFLPNHFESDYVNYYSKEKHRSIGEHQISLVVTDNNHELWLENIFYYHYQNNPNITIKKLIFYNPISVSCKQNKYLYLPYSLYILLGQHHTDSYIYNTISGYEI